MKSATDARIAAALAPEAAVIKRELQPKEQILWIARPHTAACAWALSRSKVASAFPLAGLAAVWTYVALQGSKSGDLFPMIGGLMFLGALGLLLSPIWYYLVARSTVYAITDSRAIVLTTFPGYTVVSHLPRDMGELEKNMRGDGVGNLVFRREVKKDSDSTKTVKHGFFGIPDVTMAEQQIRRMIGDAR